MKTKIIKEQREELGIANERLGIAAYNLMRGELAPQEVFRKLVEIKDRRYAEVKVLRAKFGLKI